MQILHLPHRIPLRIPYALAENHDLLLDALILRQLLPQRRLDAHPHLDVILGDERNRMPGLPGPRRPAHAVDVRLTIRRQIEIKHDIDGRDIQTAGSHISRDEDLPAAGAKLAEGAEAGGLGELAVEGDGGEAEGAEEDGEALRLVDGAGEDDGGVAGVLVEEVDEVEVLVLVGEEGVGLEEGGDGVVFPRGDGDAQRVGERGALQRLDLGRHGGGEEVGAPLAAREHFEDLVEDGAEVEVEQAVGFVHDEVFEVAQREAFGVFEVVEEAAGGGDDDVRFLAERDGLRDHVHAADDDGATD